MATFLIQKGTGDKYVYSAHMAARDDMEIFEESDLSAPAPKPAPKKKAAAKPKAKKAAKAAKAAKPKAIDIEDAPAVKPEPTTTQDDSSALDSLFGDE